MKFNKINEVNAADASNERNLFYELKQSGAARREAIEE